LRSRPLPDGLQSDPKPECRSTPTCRFSDSQVSDRNHVSPQGMSPSVAPPSPGLGAPQIDGGSIVHSPKVDHCMAGCPTGRVVEHRTGCCGAVFTGPSLTTGTDSPDIADAVAVWAPTSGGTGGCGFVPGPLIYRIRTELPHPTR
jgi:hypothetical protein